MDRALRPPRGAPRPAGGAGRRRSRAAGRTWRAAARAPSAALERGPAALEVARDARAARARRRARSASCRPCPPRAAVSASKSIELEVEVDELLGAQAARVGELEQRAVAQLERRRGRDPVQQAATSSRLERARQPLRLLGRRQQVGGVRPQLAVLDQRAEERANGRELAGDRASARSRARRAARRSGAGRGRSTSAGAMPRAAGPGRELAEVDAVGAARALGGAAALRARGRSARRALRPGLGLACERRGRVLHRHRHGSGRHPAPARRGRRASARRPAAAALASRSRARATRSTMWYAVMRKQVRDMYIGALCTSPFGPPRLPAAEGLAGGPGRGDRRRSGRRSRMSRPRRCTPTATCGRRARSRPGSRMRTQPCEAA